MLTPSNVTIAQYNNAILNGNNIHARIVFPVQDITLTDDNIAADGGIVINSVMNPDTDLVMGKAVATEVIIRLFNGSIFNGFDWTEEFHIDFGVEIGANTQWVTVGYFKGKKPKRTVGVNIIEFTAYDRMLMFDDLADDFVAGLTFPCTMEDIYQALCSYVGVSYAAGDEIQDAMEVEYSENPFVSGVTCRTILSYIAEANCCYAKISNEGDLKLSWFTDHTDDYVLTEDDHFGVDIDETNTPVIDSVRISSTEDEDAGGIYPVGNNDVIYGIVDNPLLLCMGFDDRSAVLAAILTRLSNFGSYSPASMNAVGNWMVETGDIITVEHDDDSTVLPIFTRGFIYTGGCTDAYESTGNTDREMTPAVREQYQEGGKLSRKYNMVSGVDITEDGVTISGQKYLKLLSGGVLDVQSQNFTIDSDNGYVQSGNWKFDDEGLSLREVIDDHNIDMTIGKDTVAEDAYYSLFIDRDIEPFTVGIVQHYAPILRFGAIDNRGESDDFSWQLSIDYVKNPISPLLLGDPGLIPSGHGNWHLGSEDNPFGTAYLGIANMGIAQADKVLTNDYSGGEAAYTTMASLVSRISEASTGGVLILRIGSGLTGTFFSSANNYAAVLLVMKASSNNAYFLAFNRNAASVGNISLTDRTVSTKTMLS